MGKTENRALQETLFSWSHAVHDVVLSFSSLSLLKKYTHRKDGLRVILGAGGGWCEEVTKTALC